MLAPHVPHPKWQDSWNTADELNATRHIYQKKCNDGRRGVSLSIWADVFVVLEEFLVGWGDGPSRHATCVPIEFHVMLLCSRLARTQASRARSVHRIDVSRHWDTCVSIECSVFVSNLGTWIPRRPKHVGLANIEEASGGSGGLAPQPSER